MKYKNMRQLTEEEIIAGCLKNDRAAQKALYDQYKTRMFTLAYRITNSIEDAGDALQEGFLEVFSGLKSFRGDSGLGTWIHTIMARQALKKIRNRIHFDDLDDTNETVVIDWGSEIEIQHLENAIANLPDGYRSVFTLYEIEGFSHNEIARMMEISVSTSKTQLHKAKRLLISKLKER